MSFIKSVTFDSSYPSAPQLELPQFAFCGRSNVGKSSLINAILNRKIARISKIPGKTTLINTFIINEMFYLVDLPGYGYAKRSKSMLKSWKQMIDNYLKYSHNLIMVYVLIDSRHKAMRTDMDFIEWLVYYNKPFNIVFTKSDKSSQKIINENIGNLIKQSNAPYFLTSAQKKKGIDKICRSMKTNLENILT